MKFAFNAKNLEAQRLARRYAAEHIDKINQDTRRAVREAIAGAIRDKRPPRDAARVIQSLVGTTRSQQKSLTRYAAQLAAQPTWAAKSAAQKTKILKKYRDKLIRRRAQMIARTETVDALNAGSEVSWVQAQRQGLLGKKASKEWVTTPVGACSICRDELNGQIVLLGKTFQSKSIGALERPTAHPNCRCTIAPVKGELEATIAPDRVKATARKTTTRKGLKAEGKVEVKAGTVNADGEILRGSDVRKALITYAEELPEGRQILKEIERHNPALARVDRQIVEFRAEWEKAAKLKAAELRKELRFTRREIKKAQKELRAKFRPRLDHLLSRKERLLSLVEKPLARQAEHVRQRFLYNAAQNDMFETVTKVQLSQVEASELREGVTAFRRMIDDTIGTTTIGGTAGQTQIVTSMKKAVVNFIERVQRASFGEFKGSEKVYRIRADFASSLKRPHNQRSTIVHEMAHGAEASSPDVLAEAIRFRDLRTKGEKVQGLRDLFPGANFRKTEVTYTDEWLKRDVYFGKRYREGARLSKVPHPDKRRSNNLVFTKRDGWQRATEIVSQGMEKMYYNPIQFAKDDPRTFDFIYERIIKRKYTNKSSKYALDIKKDLEVVEIVKESWGDVRSLRLRE